MTQKRHKRSALHT